MSGGKRGKKSSMSRKGKSSKSMSGGSWLAHVKKTYAALKKSRKGASLGDAMKAAKKTYKKSRK
jgi:hypothetical protein